MAIVICTDRSESEPMWSKPPWLPQLKPHDESEVSLLLKRQNWENRAFNQTLENRAEQPMLFLRLKSSSSGLHQKLKFRFHALLKLLPRNSRCFRQTGRVMSGKCLSDLPRNHALNQRCRQSPFRRRNLPIKTSERR